MEFVVLDPIWSIAPLVLGGIIAGGASLIGSAINTFGGSQKMGLTVEEEERLLNKQSELNKEAAEGTFKYGELAADNAQQRQWETYDKYQSPQAMVKQYKEAGLNPALMNGGGGGGGMGSGQTGTGAQVQPADVASVRSAMIQSKLLQQQVIMNKVAIGEKAAQIGKTVAETKNIETQRKTGETNNSILEATKNDLIEIKGQEREKILIENSIRNLDYAVKEWETTGKDSMAGNTKVSEGVYARKVYAEIDKLENEGKIKKNEAGVIEEYGMEMGRLTKKFKEGEITDQMYRNEISKWLKSGLNKIQDKGVMSDLLQIGITLMHLK